jgi:diguanylate cyclase (GGDEF)-like protein
LLHFEHVERFERRRAVSQLRAQSEHFVTRAEAQRADFLAEQSRLEALRQRALAQEQAHKAEQDALTQLGNRRLVLRRWPELLAAQGGTEGSEASHSVLALALIDIDHFKRVNDCFGHAAGDQVLVELAGLLRQHTRSTDVLARHGGEEFLVLFPGLSMPEAEEACDRLRVCVNAYDWSPVLGVERSITISIGLAAAPPLELNALVQLADEALYRAKQSGRDRVCCQPLAA